MNPFSVAVCLGLRNECITVSAPRLSINTTGLLVYILVWLFVLCVWCIPWWLEGSEPKYREYFNVMSAIGESMWSSTLHFKELLVYFTWTDMVKRKRWITVDTASLLVTFPWGVRENKVWRQPRTSSLCFECTWIHFFLGGWGSWFKKHEDQACAKELESKRQSAKCVSRTVSPQRVWCPFRFSAYWVLFQHVHALLHPSARRDLTLWSL